MIWATWRQHRPEALAAAAVVAAMAAAIAVLHSTVHLAQPDITLVQDLGLAFFVLPALVGVFIGAPLLARDLEQGMHRLVWTQGVTRSRWLRVKLLHVFAAVAAGAGLVGGLATILPFAPPGWNDGWPSFDMQLPAFAAYTLFALALGIAVGVVVGRTYPAMALTLLLFGAARVAVGVFLRPRYADPMRFPIDSMTHTQIPPGQGSAWFLDDRYFDAGGHERSLDDVLNLMNHQQLGDRLSAYGLTGWSYYQPIARFWQFQTIETAIFLGLAALLVGLAYFWTTRRVQ